MSAGDELKLKHTCAGPLNKAWQGIGIVIRLDEASEEVLPPAAPDMMLPCPPKACAHCP